MMRYQKNKGAFILGEMQTKVEDARASLIYMIFKDDIEPIERYLKAELDGRNRVGASVNPFELPIDSTNTKNNLITT